MRGEMRQHGENGRSARLISLIAHPSSLFFYFLLPLGALARMLPHPMAQRLGAFVGDMLFWSVPRYRAVARRNLQAALGWEPARVEAVARQVFCNIGKTLIEFLRLPILSAEALRALCGLEGMQHLRTALAAGKGAMIVTAHYGSWELLAARLIIEGVPLSVVARDADDGATNAFINRIRAQCGYHVIPRQSAPRQVLEALRRNEVVAILIDQNTTVGGRFVPFFGRMASTVTGPAQFALRTGAALLPGFAHRLADGRHIGRIDPPLTLFRTEDREKDILTITTHLTAMVEAQVRADPTQWFWIHDRWRHRPPEEPVGAETARPRAAGVNTHDDVPPHPATEP